MLNPDPRVWSRSLQQIAEDVADRVEAHRSPDLLIGFSMGSVPATIAADRFQCRLWSLASADRGDLMIWSSRKARDIRVQAEGLGYRRQDFAHWLHGLNPIDCIDGLHSDSRLVFGVFDRYIRCRGVCHLPGRRPVILVATGSSRSHSAVAEFCWRAAGSSNAGFAPSSLSRRSRVSGLQSSAQRWRCDALRALRAHRNWPGRTGPRNLERLCSSRLSPRNGRVVARPKGPAFNAHVKFRGER